MANEWLSETSQIQNRWCIKLLPSIIKVEIPLQTSLFSSPMGWQDKNKDSVRLIFFINQTIFHSLKFAKPKLFEALRKKKGIFKYGDPRNDPPKKGEFFSKAKGPHFACHICALRVLILDQEPPRAIFQRAANIFFAKMCTIIEVLTFQNPVQNWQRQIKLIGR